MNCKVDEQRFGPHGGRQMRSPRYFSCGCDCGKCESHVIPAPFGPSYVPGEPRKCKKHRVAERGGK